MRFSLGIERVGGVPNVFAQCGHGFQHRIEDFAGVLALLHHLLPPAFAIAVTGGLGQCA